MDTSRSLLTRKRPLVQASVFNKANKRLVGINNCMIIPTNILGEQNRLSRCSLGADRLESMEFIDIKHYFYPVK